MTSRNHGERDKSRLGKVVRWFFGKHSQDHMSGPAAQPDPEPSEHRRAASEPDILPPAPPSPPTLRRQESYNLRTLVDMGFTPEQAGVALQASDNDMIQALELLLAMPPSNAYRNDHPAAAAEITPNRKKQIQKPPQIRSQKSHEQPEVCLICLDTFDNPNDPSRPKCGHRFHSHCWRGYLNNNINDRKVIDIQCPSCSRVLLDTEIHGLLQDPKMISKYSRFLADAILEKDPNVRWCPKARCGAPIKTFSFDPPLQPQSSQLNTSVFLGVGLGVACIWTGIIQASLRWLSPNSVVNSSIWTWMHIALTLWFLVMSRKEEQKMKEDAPPDVLRLKKSTCEKCHHSICFDCRADFHPGQTCAQAESAIMRDWTKTHDTGRCPKCKAIIERTAGCNHMKCRCRYEFCWLCGGEYTSNHFSQGLCRQFGGVGIGVKVEESSETLEPLDSHLLKMKAGFVGTLIILIFSRAYGARDDGSLRATFNVFYWLSGWFPSTILYLFFSYLVFYLIKHKFLNSRVPFCEIAGNRFLQFCLFLSPALLVPTAFLALRILNSITCSTISLLFMDKNILDLIVFVPSFMKLVFFRKTIWLIHSIFALLFCVFGAVVGKSISIRNNAIKVLLSVTWLTAALRMVIITLPGLPQIWIFKCYLWLTEKAATVIHLSVLHFLGVASGYFIEIVLLKLLGLHEPSSPVNIQTRMDPGPARTQLLKLLRFIPSDSSIETASRPALVVLHQGYLYALFLVVHNVDKMISSLFRLTPILNTAFGHAIFWLEYIPLIPIISLRKTGHFHTAVFNSGMSIIDTHAMAQKTFYI